MKQIYRVSEYDNIEGKVLQRSVLFESLEDAQTFRGKDQFKTGPEALLVLEPGESVQAYSDAQLVRSALSKLTRDEIRALGVEWPTVHK
jgi:hypothetical protein